MDWLTIAEKAFLGFDKNMRKNMRLNREEVGISVELLKFYALMAIAEQIKAK